AQIPGAGFGRSLALSGGKILVSGELPQSGTGGDFLVARYNTDGTLDSTFGTGGWAIIDFARSDDTNFGLAVQADCKVLLVGRVDQQSTYYDFGVARLNVDGTPDTSFGNAGRVTIDFGTGGDDSAFAVAVQADGRVVV